MSNIPIGTLVCHRSGRSIAISGPGTITNTDSGLVFTASTTTTSTNVRPSILSVAPVLTNMTYDEERANIRIANGGYDDNDEEEDEFDLVAHARRISASMDNTVVIDDDGDVTELDEVEDEDAPPPLEAVVLATTTTTTTTTTARTNNNNNTVSSSSSSSSSSNGTALERLTCPICFHVPVDAQFLSCAHAFCKECINGHFSTRGNNGNLMRNCNRCPVCQFIVEMPRGLTIEFQSTYPSATVFTSQDYLETIARGTSRRRDDTSPNDLRILTSRNIRRRL